MDSSGRNAEVLGLPDAGLEKAAAEKTEGEQPLAEAPHSLVSYSDLRCSSRDCEGSPQGAVLSVFSPQLPFPNLAEFPAHFVNSLQASARYPHQPPSH